VVAKHLHRTASTDNLPTLGLFGTDPERLAAIRNIMETTGPEERILSATGRHDKIFVTDIAFYFLADRLPGTRWHHYDPGVQTTEAVQQEMIREIETNHIAVIVRNAQWDKIKEPNKSALSSGTTILDAYIDQNFREEQRFGPISVHRCIACSISAD
jgi:hypothetical protein